MRVRQADIPAGKRGAVAMLLALATLALNSPVLAAEKHTDPFTTIANTKFHADPGPVPEFVEKSRPAQGSDYIPLHAPGIGRHAKPKTAAELKAMEADLDTAAAANRRRAGLPAGDSAKKSSKVSTVRSGPAAPIH